MVFTKRNDPGVDWKTLYIPANVPNSCSELRFRSLNKRLTIQRRLAWSLSKNDTHNRREANLFLSFDPMAMVL